MYNNEINSEYYLLSCQACLSSNRKLTMVGDLVDVYRKICDNSPMLTAQTTVCWECLALLKKVRAFKKKVENAQKILAYCIDEHSPPQASLSGLMTTFTETTTFVAIEKEDDLEDIKIEPVPAEEYIDLWKEKEEQSLFTIEDVRGQCDIVDVKPLWDLSSGSSDLSFKLEPGLAEEDAEAEADRKHQCWQRAAMLVYKRLCGHKYACHFLRPVSDELAPEYSKIVKRPMDLSTIKRNIKDGVIRTTAELQRDLMLMFSNALMYNASEHAIYHMTQELRQEAHRELTFMIAAQTQAAAPTARRRRMPSSLATCITKTKRTSL